MTKARARKAVILAAGAGRRLGSFSEAHPKPLLEINGTPILGNCLARLKEAGVEEVVLVVGHFADQIKAFAGEDHSGLKIRYIESEAVESQGARVLQGMDAILVPGGFGERGIEGKIAAARYAREAKIPYLGICLGMQVAVIEYARNVCGLLGAHSTEFNPQSPHPVIALVTEWRDADGKTHMRSAQSNKGGTMRLGVQSCKLKAGSRTRALYNSEVIVERHRHRFEFNNDYKQILSEKGLDLVAEAVENELVEMVELPNHPWFIGCQFHPEFTSTPRDGHPLFEGFIRAARDNHLANQSPEKAKPATKAKAA